MTNRPQPHYTQRRQLADLAATLTIYTISAAATLYQLAQQRRAGKLVAHGVDTRGNVDGA
jgi:hypothetical protein